jgi:uncharacterized protein YjdB
VSTSGLVTALATGAATITATSEGVQGRAAVTVTTPTSTAPGTVSDFAVSGGTDTSVTVVFTEVNDGTGLPASYDVRYAVGPLSWGSAASVGRGTCTTPVAGTAIGAKRTCTVVGLAAATGYQFELVAFRGPLSTTSTVFGGLSNVASGATAPHAAPVATVTLSLASASVAVGATQQVTAILKDAAGNMLPGRTVTWASSSPGVASVSTSGLVTALATGAATITATSEGQSGSTPITVTVVPVTSVAVSPATASVTVGQILQLTATPKDASGYPLSGRVVTWATSTTAVATVSTSGLVTGVAAGTATITATSEGQRSPATISVMAPVNNPVAMVTVSPASGSVALGQTLQLVATPRDVNGNPLSGRVITWASSNSLLANVTGSGQATGVAVGVATVTATSEGQSGSAALTVTASLPFPVPDLLNNATFETGWDGFVSWSYGTPGPATGAFSLSRSQDVAHDGVWSVKSTFGATGVDANVQFAYPFGDHLDVYARVWFSISGAVPNNHHKWIRFQTAGFNGVQGGLYLASSTGGMTWCDAGTSPNSNVDMDIGVGIPTFNTWHSIEVEYDRTGWNTAHGPRVRFWYDGAVTVGPTPPTSVTAYWGDNSGVPNATGPWLYIGGPQGSAVPSNILIFDDTYNAGNTAAGTFYYDRVAVSTQRIGP